MAFDPSVISSIGEQPDLPGAVGKGFQLKDMLDTNTLNQFKLREAKQTEQDTKTSRDILSKYDISNPKQASEAASQLQKKGLTAQAMDVLKGNQAYQSGQYEQQLNQLQLYQNSLDLGASIFDPIYQQATAMRTDGKHTDAEVSAFIQSKVPTAIKQFQEADDSMLPPNFKQMVLKNIQQKPVKTYDELQNIELQSKQMREKAKAQMDQLKGQSAIETQRGNLEERKRHDLAVENASKQRQGTEEEIDKSAQAIANYQMAPPTGASRSPAAMRLMARVMELNPDYDANQFQSRRKAESDFSTGKQGQAVKSFNVALSHLDVLQQASDALKNGNVRAFNQLSQTVATATGNPAPTDFNAIKHIVGDEIVKAVVGAGGGVADRENAAKTVDAANSPAQLAGVINRYKQLMKGQLDGLKKQYESTTGRTDFDKFLTPEAQTNEAGGATAAPSANSNDPLGIRQ